MPEPAAPAAALDLLEDLLLLRVLAARLEDPDAAPAAPAALACAAADGIGRDPAGGPRCGGRGGDPAASGELECSCQALATWPRG